MAKKSNKKVKRKGNWTIADANMIVPIQTREDPMERLRKWTDPKRYANPNSKDGKWPRRIKV